ncbi:hypothetical protein D9M68_862560 [compost metagenome]
MKADSSRQSNAWATRIDTFAVGEPVVPEGQPVGRAQYPLLFKPVNYSHVIDSAGHFVDEALIFGGNLCGCELNGLQAKCLGELIAAFVIQ